MNIRKVRIKRTAVVIDYENDGETHSITSKDCPLPSFYDAVKALGPIIVHVLHLPAAYLGKPSPKDLSQVVNPLTPTGVTVSEKQGAQLVCITGQKDLPECHSPFNLATPLRFMSHPEEEGTYSPALTDAQVEVIERVLGEARAYVAGDRAQGVLPLETEEDQEEAEAAEPKEGDVLDFKETGEDSKKGRNKGGAAQ